MLRINLVYNKIILLYCEMFRDIQRLVCLQESKKYIHELYDPSFHDNTPQIS